MKVTLIQKPQDLISTIYLACKTCYSGNTIAEIYEKSKNIDEEKKLALIKKVIQSEHFSVLEHCSFTFGINGVSRACTHQLVRHRLMSYSQQSLRYVEIKESELNNETYEKYFVTPKNLTEEQKEKRINFCLECLKMYLEEVKSGVKPEDARGILPMSIKSNIVVTCNLRALIEMSEKRLCLQAQEEIREMTEEMRNLIVKEYPFLSSVIIPNCANCKDFRECARRTKN